MIYCGKNWKEAVAGELMAHLKYLMFAERARRRGIHKVANLFEALAASRVLPCPEFLLRD